MPARIRCFPRGELRAYGGGLKNRVDPARLCHEEVVAIEERPVRRGMNRDDHRRSDGFVEFPDDLLHGLRAGQLEGVLWAAIADDH